MKVTEVKIKLVQANRDRLKAYCTMTLDDEFVVRDLKLIEGTHGMFVAMPSRKLTDRCPKCRGKNHLRARFCNNCGAKLDENRASTDREGRPKLHADIAHPINSECRQRIQEAIEAAYREELERSKEPGYRPVSLDEDDDSDYDYHSSDEDRPSETASDGEPEGSQSAERTAPEPQGAEPDSPEQDTRDEDDDESDERTFGEGIL